MDQENFGLFIETKSIFWVNSFGKYNQKMAIVLNVAF